MNLRSLEVLKDLYRPTKVTMLKDVQILESTSGTFVIKEKKEKNIREIYDYLSSRNFSYFPALIDDSRDGVNVYSYVSDFKMPKEQKAMDFIKIVGLLHQKTTYYKDVSSDEYKKIYEDVSSQIEYLTYFYEQIYGEYFKVVFPSPSENLLLTNISKILASLNFSRNELEDWYKKVTILNRYRVCQIHNNLCLEHYHKSDGDYLLSWDKSCKDSPVKDLVEFYKCSYFDLNFEVIFNEYLRVCPWSEEEKQLFFIVISLPPKFLEKGSEFQKVNHVRNVLDYVYKTEHLIRPYYSKQEK